MQELDAMRIYLRVAELAGFSAAAANLGIPKSTVSSAIQQLEDDLGTRLLHRTTRKVQMTQDGQVFYQRCKDLLADVEELKTLFRQDPAALAGRLRVDMPLAIARDLVLPHLPEFLQQHPGLELELSSTDRQVDIIGEGFDCVLRVGELKDSSLIARPLGYYRIVSCASPAYLQRTGTPTTLEELRRHQLVNYVQTLGGHDPGFEYYDPQSSGQLRYFPMSGNLTVNNSESYLQACLAGIGIIQAPKSGMLPYLQSGQLVEILPQYQSPPIPVAFVYPNRRHLPKRVRVFMDWVEALVLPRLE